MKKIDKAMILCAGLGTRLHPITHDIPKPLVPILNIPNVLHSLNILKKSGITDVIVNLFHLPQAMESFLKDGREWGMKISYSKETELMGTGGGVKLAQPFFENKPFVLLNCDFVSNINLTPFIKRHFESTALATMILFQDPIREKKYSRVGVNQNGELCALPKLQNDTPSEMGLFTGIHILNPKIFEFLPKAKCGINDVLYPALMKEYPNKVKGDFFRGGYWYDTGEQDTILSATFSLLKSLKNKDQHLLDLIHDFSDFVETEKEIWVSKKLNFLSNKNLLGPCIIEEGVTIEEGAQVGPYSVLGKNSLVKKGQKVSYFVGIKSRVESSCIRPEGTLFYLENSL